jgi:hypothetical protein
MGHAEAETTLSGFSMSNDVDGGNSGLKLDLYTCIVTRNLAKNLAHTKCRGKYQISVFLDISGPPGSGSEVSFVQKNSK